MHVAADGRRYLLIHGDEFDQVTKYHRWLAILGDHAYAVVVRLNVWLSWLRRTLGIPGYWSLSGYAKYKVKSAVSFIFDFEDSVLRHARERGCLAVSRCAGRSPSSCRSAAPRRNRRRESPRSARTP